jgi:putative DNA primase/helicase
MTRRQNPPKSTAPTPSPGARSLRAHFLAGRPTPAKPLGSYEVWSDRVRSPLLWLGEPDPCDTMEKARDSDRKLEALRTILDQWEAVLGEDRFLARQAADKASEREDSDNQSFRYPDFREALMAVAGDHGTINNHRLGNWLQANKGRIIQGRRIVPDGGRSGALYWRLELVERL